MSLGQSTSGNPRLHFNDDEHGSKNRMAYVNKDIKMKVAKTDAEGKLQRI